MTDQKPPYLVPGFRFAGISAGIKKRGGPDLALIACDGDAVAAGVFTQNIVRAAPVEVAHQRVQAGVARAILVNSGNANACTGEPGTRATLESSAAVAEALGVAPELVLPCSTGVIGQVLPAERIVSHAAPLVAELNPDAAAFANAILTTDRFAKLVRCPVETDAGSATLLGIAKGAGMIHPDLDTGLPQATMLAYLLTDAKVSAEDLRAALLAASQVTFNACSVDGDTSTNDTVLALASGVHAGTASRERLERAMREVCKELARLMVRDGEGADHSVAITVAGLTTAEDARRAAHTVATSLLVKTALTGKDPNWGRLLAAAGRSGVRFDPKRASIHIGDVLICEHGMGLGAEAEARATAVMQTDDYGITVTLGDGPHAFTYTTCDLGHGYVDVNAGYRT
ncbi:MAG: bifunctional glutamate N-acetyltransferase/amino-acid acetyltransferase ArgJ [Polyangiaceae bacterium]